MGITKIVTNAVCDLTPENAGKYGITMIPECIIFDNVPYLSNIDIDPPELYKKLRSSKKLPTGSHPNVGMYMDAFESLKGQCDEIICINMTSKMSGSFNTANIAKEMLEDEDFPAKIYIYDSLQLSHGLGFLARSAAELAQEGKSASEIIEHLDKIRDKVGIYFVMKSLLNATKGGRLGAIKMVLADTLNIKPVLRFKDGIETDVALVHTYKQALESLTTYYEKDAHKGLNVTVFHADCLAAAQSVKKQIEQVDPNAKVAIEWLGSAIGIYTGDGCVGITFWEN